MYRREAEAEPDAVAGAVAESDADAELSSWEASLESPMYARDAYGYAGLAANEGIYDRDAYAYTEADLHAREAFADFDLYSRDPYTYPRRDAEGYYLW